MKTKSFILGAIFAIFFSTALIVSSQHKKPTAPAVKPTAPLIKPDSIIIALPDSTQEKIRMADMKAKKLDSITLIMEKKVSLDRKQNDALKRQGKELEKINRGLALLQGTRID